MLKTEKLVGVKELLKLVWSGPSRPQPQWLRDQARKGKIPAKKVGNFFFFDPDQVRKALGMEVQE